MIANISPYDSQFFYFLATISKTIDFYGLGYGRQDIKIKLNEFNFLEVLM